jgi:hypothetical protein
MDRTATIQAFVDLLETVRQSYLAHAARRHLPLLVDETRILATREGSVTRGDPERISVNALGTWRGPDYSGALSADAQQDLLKMGRHLCASFDGCRVQWLRVALPLGSLEPPERTDDLYRKDPEAHWWASLVFHVTHAYLRALPSLDHVDETLAHRLVGECLDFLSTRRVMLRTTVAVSGLECDEPEISHGPITVRTLSALEQGSLLEATIASLSLRLSLFVRPTALRYVTHAIECTSFRPWESQPQDDCTRQILMGFLLEGYEVFASGATTSVIVPQWLSVGQSLRWPRLERWPRAPRRIRVEDLERVYATAQALKPYDFEQPTNPHDLALARFLLGCGRQDDTDAMLDCMIALEAVLLPDVESEVSYRFGLHGALWLGEEPNERRALMREFRSLYKLRSRTVHGGSPFSASERSSAASQAHDFAQRALLKAVRTQFPTADRFTELVVGIR